MFHNRYITATFAATAIFIAPLSAAATLSYSAFGVVAAKLSPAVAPPVMALAANNDLERCSSFSLRVYSACLDQAKRKPENQSARIRGCRDSYHGNLERCRTASQ